MPSLKSSDSIYDNEVPFCRAYGLERKQALEKLFLKERISYYVVWQNDHWWQRFFSGKKKEVCTFRINRADVPRARELVAEMKGVRIRNERRS